MARSATAVISLAVVASAVASTASAAATPTLTVVNQLPKPLVLTLTDTSKDERAAPLILLIQNPTKFDGELRVRFIVNKTGRIATVSTQTRSPAPTDRPLIFNIGGNLAIGKKQTRLVQLRFTIPRNADPSILDGVLVIKLASTAAKAPKTAKALKTAKESLGALVLQTHVGVDTGPDPGTEAPQPPSPALQVTSYWPFKHSNVYGEHQTVLLAPKRDEALGRKQVVILGSSSAGLLRVTLTTRPGDEAHVNGMTKGTIKVDHVGRTGTYSGDIVLGPGKNDKLKLTVNVRDFFAWALLALALGAGLGGYGTRWWEGKRRKELLIARAQAAYDAYKAFIDTPPPPDPKLPPRPDAEKELETLRDAISRANTDDDYNKQVDAVAEYEAALSRYKRLATAAKALLPEGIPAEAEALARDVDFVRAEMERPPTEAKRADEFADQAERLAGILGSFIQVWKLWEHHGRPHDADGNELSPVGCYSRGAYRTERRTREVQVCLTQRRHAIEQQAALALEEFRGRGVGALDLGALWERWSELVPTAIQRRVRMFDWTIASASALITLLAFLLTIYDENFGSIGDYAKAFTAGFLGQLAGATIAWNLFPAFRSYRATRTDAATKTTASAS